MSVAKITKTFGYSVLRFKNALLHKNLFLFLGAAPQQYVVCVDGSEPFIKYQMERGLDWTISSVAGESYRLDVRRTLTLTLFVHYMIIIPTYLWILVTRWQIDLTDVLESHIRKNLCFSTNGTVKVSPVWRNASFTLKYYSDALFDFPHWFGFSKRSFKVSLKKVSYSSWCFVCTRCLTFALLHLYQWQLRATWAARDWFESGGHWLSLLMDSCKNISWASGEWMQWWPACWRTSLPLGNAGNSLNVGLLGSDIFCFLSGKPREGHSQRLSGPIL